MESIKVTPENLRAKAREVDDKASEYNNGYTAFLKDVETLTSSDWKGEDADAFKDQVEGFREDFNKMRELMNEYANFLRQAADNYENTQRDVKSTIRGLQN